VEDPADRQSNTRARRAGRDHEPAEIAAKWLAENA
jgi:hypothetical protein